jgi:NAD(P)-dependent dehydrogenase (short-subunit alcohol dehydrogenase family)
MPADIARLIAFLASAENRVTRGAVIPVYGGS